MASGLSGLWTLSGNLDFSFAVAAVDVNPAVSFDSDQFSAVAFDMVALNILFFVQIVPFPPILQQISRIHNTYERK